MSVVFVALGRPGDVPATAPDAFSDILGLFGTESAALAAISSFPRTGKIVMLPVDN